ncbi:protein NOV homolog [Pomacea canaliculata]|uniref:protein NOV homolog n=1 Tax=Pomacea canaliculata TaxID=400727 RepID=UPI000D72AB96|nr:protein NOV homolog [Pomacea canaliculata]
MLTPPTPCPVWTCCPTVRSTRSPPARTPTFPWARDNCRAFCNLCTTGNAVATPNDNCTYDGKMYKQDQTWLVGCDQQCVCEDAVYGYYCCYNRCPQYTNVPSECTRAPAGDGCCETITCPASSLLTPSTTNILSLGSGNGILQPNPLSPTGQLIQVVPTLPPGATVGPNTALTGYQVPPISVCARPKVGRWLYPGVRVYQCLARFLLLFFKMPHLSEPTCGLHPTARPS